ncbi:MAG TPA: ABC transporter ATP-binding protein [Patescibacteria group bacterium]|nr:ABC transporter ATP-binding protein [Patescibacteria group bacterium]
MTIAAAQAEHLRIGPLSKTFELPTGAVLALDNITLDVPGGRFVAIVGASGCGKSTLLRIIAGLETRYDGHVRLGRKDITGPGLDRGVIFQEHRLLPWLTVRQNVAFGLKNLPADDTERQVREHLELVGLAGFADAYPHQLSGGMAQRVAIARALVNQPQVLLLDEPFGALDAMTKIQMQQEVLRIWEVEKTTMILVTHDIDEAIFLGDEIVIMSSRPGTIRRVLPVDLPRPRDRSSPDFIALRKEIFREFFAEADQPFIYQI